MSVSSRLHVPVRLPTECLCRPCYASTFPLYDSAAKGSLLLFDLRYVYVYSISVNENEDYLHFFFFSKFQKKRARYWPLVEYKH
jgi:hypothetical protein